MDKVIPRFVRRRGPNGSRITFITMTRNGVKQELSLWELLDKYSADQILKMREQYPEIEEK